MLEASADPETLSNRVVHVSVQLFSNESLAVRMVEQLNLLHVMVISLKRMMSSILIQSTLHGVYSTTVCCCVLCCMGWLETKLLIHKCVEVTIESLCSVTYECSA
jgi:hypothetical protein